MDIRPSIKILARLMLLLGINLGFMCLKAYVDNDARMIPVFANCFFYTIIVGAVGCFIARRHRRENKLSLAGTREGYLIVALAWLLAIVIGALPFIFGASMRISDAIFETASGLTTTGATVISNELVLRNGLTLAQEFPEIAQNPTVLPLPESLLLWRAVLNWLGGCGIIFFVLLVVPFSTFGRGLLLYNAEVPGLKNDESVVPTLRESITSVAVLYVILSACCMLFLRWGGMTWFDALCHALSTISTGGFSTKSASVGYYHDNPFIQWTLTIFMLLSACNFSQILKLFLNRSGALFRDEEFRCFIGAFLAVLGLITAFVYCRNMDGLTIMGTDHPQPRSVLGYMRTVAFQLATVLSTTGFVTSDYELWNTKGGLLLIIFLMFPCGCGGSTAGGIKFSRIVVAGKELFSEIKHCLYPHAIEDIRFNGAHLNGLLVRKTMAFIILYFAICAGVVFLLLFIEAGDIDLRTAFGASITTLSNVGPGLGKVGASDTFGWMTAQSKLLLSLNMVTGRLELYTILVLFTPSFWRR